MNDYYPKECQGCNNYVYDSPDAPPCPNCFPSNDSETSEGILSETTMEFVLPMTGELTPEMREKLAEGLGIDPFDIPTNIQDVMHMAMQTSISQYINSAPNGKEAFKRIGLVVSTAGAAFAGNVNLARRESDPELDLSDPDEWELNPKMLIETLLEMELIPDENFMADSWEKRKHLFSSDPEADSLEALFNLPSSDEGEGSSDT